MTQPDDIGPTQAPRNDAGVRVAPPGRLTAAATLACLQAGLTSVTTILVLAGAGSEGGPAAFQVPVGVAQAAGVVLLIMGAWRLMRGKSRSTLTVGWSLELVICLYYMIRYAANKSGGPTTGIESAGLIGVAVLFAIMPVIGLMLASSEQTGTTPRISGDRIVIMVLALVQAGITLIITGILMIGLLLTDVDVEPTASANVATPFLSTTAGDVETSASPGELWTISLAQLIGVALLISGGVRLASDRARALLPIAASVQVALCAYWLLRGADSLTPVMLAVIPLVTVVLGIRSAHEEPTRSATHDF